MDKQTVRQLRNGRKLSREKLAVELGISFPTLVRIEGQKYTPRLDTAIKIAEFFGVPVESIDWGEAGKELAVVA
jgi:putative transcriptional regulator